MPTTHASHPVFAKLPVTAALLDRRTKVSLIAAQADNRRAASLLAAVNGVHAMGEKADPDLLSLLSEQHDEAAENADQSTRKAIQLGWTLAECNATSTL